MVHALDVTWRILVVIHCDDLLAYRTAREPPCQKQAIDRRKVMRK